MKELNMRVLRQAYSVSLKELAAASGTTLQYLSDIELGKCTATQTMQRRIVRAFELVIDRRIEDSRRMADSLSAMRDSLFEERLTIKSQALN